MKKTNHVTVSGDKMKLVENRAFKFSRAARIYKSVKDYDRNASKREAEEEIEDWG